MSSNCILCTVRSVDWVRTVIPTPYVIQYVYCTYFVSWCIAPVCVAKTHRNSKIYMYIRSAVLIDRGGEFNLLNFPRFAMPVTRIFLSYHFFDLFLHFFKEFSCFSSWMLETSKNLRWNCNFTTFAFDSCVELSNSAFENFFFKIIQSWNLFSIFGRGLYRNITRVVNGMGSNNEYIQG